MRPNYLSGAEKMYNIKFCGQIANMISKSDKIKHYAPNSNKVWKSIISAKVIVKVTRSLTLVSFERGIISGKCILNPTRVSGETGALLVYSCLITYKRFSQRYQVNMMIYKGVIVNKTSSSYRLNACSLNVSEGNYLKTVKDTQNLRPQYRKPSRRGFQIISYMFNLNVKLPLANQICCTH